MIRKTLRLMFRLGLLAGDERHRDGQLAQLFVVIAAFFALLLFAFFVIAEVIPNVFRRSRDR